MSSRLKKDIKLTYFSYYFLKRRF